LAVWAPRQRANADDESALPPTYQPLLTVIGSLLLIAGVLGWLWSNPLQVSVLTDLALLRGSVNVVLAAVGGAIMPLLYTWFVTGDSDPSLTARGVAAGAVAGLAAAPFVQPGPAMLIGFLAGATTPFTTYIVDHLLRLDDSTGVLVTTGLPAMLGLLLLGIFADGAAGAGWQLAGVSSYLGVAGQGVSGLLVAQGFQRDFPSQLQAQVIGVVAVSMWGFLSGLIVCVPLGLLFHGLQRSEEHTASVVTPPAAPSVSAEMASSAEAPRPTRLFR
jgi:ammonium transporter, Amt family